MTNRLTRSTSPYLRQHADNPVDWFEWGDEAFEEARRRQVPILLSVGYSACHWCHVMAHESFEDPETAARMNDGFVNVKVDREERPDVDAVYMEVLQATTGHGGWPMTVFLTPDAHPIFAGTYFPRDDRPGMPSFRRVLEAVTEAWTDRRSEAVEQGRRITEAIDRGLPVAERGPDLAAFETALATLASRADRLRGGFGAAPKFPQQPVLEFLLRTSDRPWAADARQILEVTLTRMADGGIHDQVGGGFARYSVDGDWLVPHFEKMLYDNAQLARLYLWAWRRLGVDRYRVVAEETIGYMLRDLRLPDGGFASAEDADSEGEEGRFYVWSADEFRSVTGSDADLAGSFFGVTDEGNFEGSNILHVAMSAAEVARRTGAEVAEVEAATRRARRALFEARGRRVRPGLDHKVIAAWNGLVLRTLAEAGATLDRPDLIDEARRTATFVLERMRRPDGGLFRSWSDGEAKIPGFLDDHAAMATGLFTLYAVTGEIGWYQSAADLTRRLPAAFGDPAGGFFSTADDAEPLIKRPKDQMDNPLPSGNSMAAEALVTLAGYTGDLGYRSLAEETIRAGGALIDRHPSAVGHLLSVAWSLEHGVRELAVVGADADRFLPTVWERFRPGLVVAVDRTGEAGDVVPLLEGRFRPDRTLAYLCEQMVCANPVESPEQLALG